MQTDTDELIRLRQLALLFWVLIGDLGGEIIFLKRALPNDGAPIGFDIVEGDTEIRVYPRAPVALRDADDARRLR